MELPSELRMMFAPLELVKEAALCRAYSVPPPPPSPCHDGFVGWSGLYGPFCGCWLRR